MAEQRAIDYETRERYKELGLGDTPTLAQLKPHVIRMIRETAWVTEAIGLVIGHIPGQDELRDNPALGWVAFHGAHDAEKSFELLAGLVGADDQDRQR